MRLTDAAVAALQIPPGKDDVLYWDDTVPGFAVRIRSTGVRSFVFQFKVGRDTRRMSLGRVGAFKVARAREIAGELHAQVRLGRNPAAEKRAAVQRESDTFGTLANLYLDRCKNHIRASTLRHKTTHLLKYAAPLHRMSVDAVDQRAIARLLTELELASGSVSANRARATLSALYVWALKEGIATGNPVANTHKREERARDRVLNNKELALVWQALPDSAYGDIVKLLVLTGQRANEIARLRWSEIEAGQINLPRERVKNDRAHTVPLGPTALSILKLQTPRPGTDFVFGLRAGAAFADWGENKKRLDTRLAELNGAPLPHFVIHDIRRSVATGMADIGILPHTIEQILNHQSGAKGGIAGIYNRSAYALEKAQAIARWDAHVSALVRGESSNVAPLRRA